MAKFRTASIVTAGAGLLLAVAISQCGGDSTTTEDPISSSIGPMGGTITSADGHLVLTVPAGAIAASTIITVTPTAQDGAIGRSYEIGPTGTKFAVPVTMLFAYADISLGGVAPTDLRLSTYGLAGWQALSNQTLDPNAKTVSGTTLHLSPYGIIPQSAVTAPPDPAQDGGTAPDAG